MLAVGQVLDVGDVAQLVVLEELLDAGDDSLGADEVGQFA